MAADSLGQLTVDLIANTGGFEAGMDRAQRSLKAATKEAAYQANQLDKLVGQIDPVVGAYGRLDKMEEQLRAHRKAGRLDPSDFDSYLKKLNDQRTALVQTDSIVQKNAMSAKAYSAALRNVPAQFTDIAVSLQAGQAPLTVLLQQGGQLKDMFGGIGPAAKALGGYVLGLVNPLTVSAAAVAALAVAYKQGSDETTAFQTALAMTGNTAGTSVSQLSALAQQVSATSGTVGKAADVLALLAGSTRIPVESFELIAEAAVKLESATGKAASETVANFEKIAKDPTKEILALNESMNFLTASTYEQIKSLQDQGNTQAAATIATKEYAKAVNGVSTEVSNNLGLIERAWKNITDAAKIAWDTAAGIGRPSTSGPSMDKLQQELAYKTSLLGTGFEDDTTKDRIAELQKQIDLIKKRNDAEQAGLQAQESAKQLQRQILEDRIKLDKSDDEFASNAKKRAKEIEEYKALVARRAEQAQKSGDQSLIVSAEDQAKRIAEISDKYADKKVARAKAYVEDAGTKELDQAKQQYAVLMQQSQQLDEQTGKLKALGPAQQDLIKWEQELADIKEKKTLTAAQKSLLATADQITAQKQMNAQLEKDTQARKDSAEQQKILAEFTQAQADALSRFQQGLDNQVTGIGLGAEGRKRLQDDLALQTDFANQVERLRRDKVAGKISQDTYDKQRAILQDTLDKELQAYKDNYAKIDAARAQWQNGMTAALQDYSYEAGDIAGQTYGLVMDGLHGIEDEFANLAVNGKFSFKSLADSIIGDLARMAAKAYVVLPLLSALGLAGDSVGGGSAGGGGIFSSLGGGGGGISSLLSNASSVVSVAGSKFGQAIMSGWTGGDGILGGIQGALSNGGDYIGSVITSAFSTGSATAAQVAGNFAASTTPATVDLISNTVSIGGQTVGTASGMTASAASSSLASLSSVLSYVGAAYAVISSFKDYGVKGGATTAGFAAAGAAIGSVVPVIGTAAGAAIGAIVGSFASSKLFGSGEKYPELAASGTGRYINGQYTDTGVATGWTGGKKSFGDAVNLELSSTVQKFSSTLGMLYDTLGNGADVVAYDTFRQRKTSGNYSAAFGVQLDDGSVIQQLQEHAGGDIVQGIKDNYDDVMGTFLAKAIVSSKSLPDYFRAQFTEFANDWDTTADQVIKAIEGVFTRFNGVNEALTLINVDNLKLNDTGLQASDAILNMIGAMSDLDTTTATAKEKVDALNTAVSTYYQAFFTADEQFADLTKSLKNAFAGFGLELPDTREAYRSMVEDIDVTTAAGQAMFATLIGLASNADSYYKTVEQNSQAALQSAQDALAKAQAANDTYYSLFTTDAEKSADKLAGVRAEFKALGIELPETRKAFMELVYAAQKGSVAGKATAEALLGLATDADAAYDILEAAAMQGASDAFSALQRAIAAQKSSLNELLSTANTNVSDLTSISNDLGSALKSLRGDSEDATTMLRAQAQATLQSALASARAGGSLVNFPGLDDALDTVSSNTTDLYSTLEDFNRDQGRSAALIDELNTLNGKQLTNAEKTVKALQDQLGRLDQELAFAQSQLDALNGVDNSVKSVAEAVNAMNAAVVAALGAQVKGGAQANTQQNNETLVNSIYRNLLGRDADAPGLAAWTGALANGASYEQVLAAIKASAAANGQLKAFAKGTNNWDGSPALVGEFGPEIVMANNVGGSTIYPAQRSRSIMNTSANDDQAQIDTQNWREKVVKKLNDIGRNTGWLDVWNSDGMPKVRA